MSPVEATAVAVSHDKGRGHRHGGGPSAEEMERPLVAGIGFRSGVDAMTIVRALHYALGQFSLEQLTVLATLDRKAASPALQSVCRQHGLDLRAISTGQLQTFSTAGLSASAASRHLGLPGVAEPCALIAAGPGGRLVRAKCSLDGVSVALALAAAPRAVTLP